MHTKKAFKRVKQAKKCKIIIIYDCLTLHQYTMPDCFDYRKSFWSRYWSYSRPTETYCLYLWCFSPHALYTPTSLLLWYTCLPLTQFVDPCVQLYYIVHRDTCLSLSLCLSLLQVWSSVARGFCLANALWEPSAAHVQVEIECLMLFICATQRQHLLAPEPGPDTPREGTGPTKHSVMPLFWYNVKTSSSHFHMLCSPLCLRIGGCYHRDYQWKWYYCKCIWKWWLTFIETYRLWQPSEGTGRHEMVCCTILMSCLKHTQQTYILQW